VSPGDVYALREGINRLLLDASLRLKLGREAGCRVQQFFASAVLPRLEQAYQEVLEKKSRTVEWG
jgi:hypothetical protein